MEVALSCTEQSSKASDRVVTASEGFLLKFIQLEICIVPPAKHNKVMNAPHSILRQIRIHRFEEVIFM